MKDKSLLPKNVGVWIRVSSDEQAEGESPEHHLKQAREHAEKYKWKIVEIYDLAGVSGKSVKDHPECKRMMADIQSKRITGLIFSKLARLARNTVELLEFAKFFEANDADLISIYEPIDTSSPAGRFFFTTIAAVGTWEREEGADRQKKSILTRAKLGKSINGRAPYGYKWLKNNQLVQVPEEVPIRRKAYELFLQYRRKGTVAKLLNADGHRTRSGALFSDVQVGRILSCPSAMGVYVFNRVRKTGPWQAKEKPEAEWGEAKCEPIVSEETWNQVNKILVEHFKNQNHTRPGKVPVNPFGNRIWCQCGSRMYERKNIGKFFCRACRRKVPVQTLEEFMMDELHDFYGSPQQVALRREDAEKNRAEKEAELSGLQRQIQKIREEMTQTYKLYLEGGISVQGFRQFYDPIELRLNQLLAALPKLQAAVALLNVAKVSDEEVVHGARTLYEQWPKLDNDRKRVIVETVFERIEVKDGSNGGIKFAITFSDLPSSEELCKSQQLMAPALC